MTNHFDNWALNDLFAISAIGRAKGGFGFIQECLDQNGSMREETMSPPYSRQAHLLISHNFELILDAAVFVGSTKTMEKDLINEVKVNINHQLDKLWEKVTDANVKKILGIKSIDKKVTDIFEYYEVEFDSGKVMDIHNFLSIRYDINDFRNKGGKGLRPTKNDHAMDETVHVCLELSTKLSEYVSSKY